MKSRIFHFIVGLLLSICIYFFVDRSLLIENQVRALSVASLMVYWWISEPIKIYQTALIPVVLGVPLGILSIENVYLSYFHNLIFLFLGGFILAKALEKHNLHIEISRLIISWFGSKSNRIVLGFMFATALLSMWISNTATVLMILPMGLSVLKGLDDFEGKKKFSIGLLLAIAFAANVGGTATIVGTPPNSLLIANLEELYQIKIGFFDWMKLGVPFAITMLFVVYGVLYLLFFRGIKFHTSVKKAKKLNVTQKRVLLIFAITIALWISCKSIVEWTSIPLKDAYIAMFGAVLMFLISTQNSAKPNYLGITLLAITFVIVTLFGFLFKIENSSEIVFYSLIIGFTIIFVLPQKKETSLLHLTDLKSIAWGILILFGGGLALAKILAETELVKLIIDQVSEMAGLGLFTLFLILVGFAIFATELMSNMALVTVLVPLVGQFALQHNYPLIQLTAAVALAASCAFMLPVATPPNAIVFSSGKIKVKTMMRAGVLINVIAIFVIILMVRSIL